LYVVSASDSSCDGALLTIWNVQESQQALLKEGRVFRFYNLSAKSVKHEGLVQLTARGTFKFHETSFPAERLIKTGYTSRFISLQFHLHVASKKLALGMSIPSRQQFVDIEGLVLNVVTCTENRQSIYLTDASGLVTRIDNVRAVETKMEATVEATKVHRPVMFQDLRILPFDYVDNCAVAGFTVNSRIVQKISVISNEKASEENLVHCAGAALYAGTTIQAIHAREFSATFVAVGRIVGCFCSVNGLSSNSLAIQVDCGKGDFVSWDLPLFLIDDVLSMIGDEHDAMSLDPEVAEELDNVKLLQKMFVAKGVLLRFVLQKKDEGYEVRQLSVANENAVAALYFAIQADRVCKAAET
jgi:hypothetical protein